MRSLESRTAIGAAEEERSQRRLVPRGGRRDSANDFWRRVDPALDDIIIKWNFALQQDERQHIHVFVELCGELRCWRELRQPHDLVIQLSKSTVTRMLIGIP
jgi:hypothetical protein